MTEILPDFMDGMVSSEVSEELERLGRFLSSWMAKNGIRHNRSGLIEIRDPLAQAINAVVGGIEPPNEMVEMARSRVELAHCVAVRQQIDKAREADEKASEAGE